MLKFMLIFPSKIDSKSEPLGIPFWLTFSISRALRRVSNGLGFSEAFSSHLRRAKVGVSLRTSFKNQENGTLQKWTSNRCPWGSILGPKFEKNRFWQGTKIGSFLTSILGAFLASFGDPNFRLSV